MKHALRVITLLSVVALAASCLFAQNEAGPVNGAPGSFSGWSDVQQFGGWSMNTTSAVSATGSQSVQLDSCYFPLSQGPSSWFPLAVGVKVTVLDRNGTQTNSLGSSETVTITAVQSPTPTVGSVQPGYGCGFTASFSNTHLANSKIVPADKGLGSAIATLSAAGGTVVVTPNSGVTTALITGTSVGSYNVGVCDITGVNNPAPVCYSWNGTAYQQAAAGMMTPNGGGIVPFYAEQNLTLSTSGATTSTANPTNVIPANSVILGVTGRVTTTVTGCSSGWEIGDGTTAARFDAVNGTLTSGTTSVNTGAFLTTGIAVATTGFYVATASPLVVTCTGSNASAGAIRVGVYGYTVKAPAQ